MLGAYVHQHGHALRRAGFYVQAVPVIVVILHEAIGPGALPRPGLDLRSLEKAIQRQADQLAGLAPEQASKRAIGGQNQRRLAQQGERQRQKIDLHSSRRPLGRSIQPAHCFLVAPSTSMMHGSA